MASTDIIKSNDISVNKPIKPEASQVKYDDIPLKSENISEEDEIGSSSVLPSSTWDPLSSKDWDAAGDPSPDVAKRFKRDIFSLFKDPLMGIFAIPSEKNLYLVHCLIMGPFETPYEGGFFHFVVRFGPSYPLHPPRVRFMTTDAGQVRFNPNLYADGKVCVSLLGTWSGPQWSPTINLGTLLLSIQSLLCDKPFYNEPGFKIGRHQEESNNYNLMLTHETIRVAVCGQLETIVACGDDDCEGDALTSMPTELMDVMKESFVNFYSIHVDTCRKHLHLDGTKMGGLFNFDKSALFDFEGLIKRLNVLKEKLDEHFKSCNSKEDPKKN